MKMLKWYSDCLTKRPIITKALTGAVIFAIGDYLCQEVEIRYLKLRESKEIDYKRLLKQTSFGIVIAPYLHLQYCKIIPYLFPETKKYSLPLSVLYAVTVSDGLFNIGFFSYMCYVNGKGFKDFIQEIPIKLIPVQINNMKVWPFLTGFNFSFISMNYRVFFDNFMCIFWNVYLSYVENNNKVHHRVREIELED